MLKAQLPLLWQEAKKLSYQMESQNSHYRSKINKLRFNFTQIKENLPEYIRNFTAPITYKKPINIEIESISVPPEYATTDWSIYEQILIHLVNNAIKFNKPNNPIKLQLFYVSAS